MAWLPISWTVPQYSNTSGPYSGAVLKFYADGTTTPINMATDNTGGTQLADVVLDSNGYPSNGGSIFIPHIDQAYKLAMYPTEAAADADTGAIWTIDNLTPADLTDTDTDELAKVSSNDTTAGYLNGKLTGGTGITLTENSDGGNETLDIAITSPVASEASNHIRAGHVQIRNGEGTFGGFSLSTAVTQATWESVGPTSSGATNIWTALDSMPATATVLIASALMQVSPTGTSTATLALYATNGDDASPAASATNNRIAYIESDQDAAISGNSGGTVTVFIPLGPTNQDFDVYWDVTNGTGVVTLYYFGFITD